MTAGNGHDLQGFSAWLTDRGQATRNIPDYLAGLCEALNAQGFAIRRCNLATQTIHPLMAAIRHVWSDRPMKPVPISSSVIVKRRQYRAGNGMIDEVYFNSLNERNPQYLASPFYKLKSCGELYELIRPAGAEQPFPVFHDLLKLGCTAYYGLYLRSFEGIRQEIGLATASPGGFSDSRIAELRANLRLFSLHLNTLVESEIKTTLALAYIGADAGRRVCGGMIRRGDVVSIEAAIWFSDLRGFTAMSDDSSPEELVATINAYLEAAVTAIHSAGGEVLKYIGDAILAVFPSEAHGSPQAACRSALAGAAAAASRLEDLNGVRAVRGCEPLQHGVGLHFGQVRYGNIGSPDRLDFTVIGREVNVASRIEALTRNTRQPVLCSASFVEAAAVDAKSAGSFRLKGISEPMALYAPA